MPLHFCISIRFLDRVFHGRRGGEDPEWPPSPLRMFQSLVAAAARLCLLPQTTCAFRWLEKQSAPVIVAPSGVTASGYRLSVPNNAMDIVAKAWCRGNYSNSGDASPATHRTMKTVRPTFLINSDTVHYLWLLTEPLTDEVAAHIEALSHIARGVISLGWGIDMAIGHAEIISIEQANALPGERWLPNSRVTHNGLRIPVPGTLEALVYRHGQFLKRLGPDGFTAPPPLTCYTTSAYDPETQLSHRPVAAFSLRKLNGSGYRAFDTVQHYLTVAGMLRHATKISAKTAGRPNTWINTFVLGHGEPMGDTKHVTVGPERFAYLPVPSIEGRGEGKSRVIGNVRRAILYCYTDGCETATSWARRNLSGQGLVDEKTGETVALLSQIPESDKIVQHYVQNSSTWATVTPVVLPGHDDPGHYRRRLKHAVSAKEQKQMLERLSNRIDGLLRKAIVHAGFPQVLADNAELEWREAGFWPGNYLASNYSVPEYLKRFPRMHVSIYWRDTRGKSLQVQGPICIGGGRFFGLGLFAAR